MNIMWCCLLSEINKRDNKNDVELLFNELSLNTLFSTQSLV